MKAGEDNQFLVSLTDAAGKPISDARVTVTLVMPAMPAMNMPEMKSSFELTWSASRQMYMGKGQAPMPGNWSVFVEARRNGNVIASFAHTPQRQVGETMINRIIEFSMKNRWLILAVYAALAAWGYWALIHTPIDAIPDLSENQVIVFTEWQGRSPQEVEDQITYPLTVNLQGLPHVRTVRSASAFGFSMVNVIFEDSVDIYFARTRVLERLSLAGSFLPVRRNADDGAGCNRRWPGLLVHGRGALRQRHAALDSRLVHQVPAQLRARRGRGRQRRRICKAVPDRSRSDQAAGLQRRPEGCCERGGAQ
jgi:hypothetical protein